MSLVVDASVVAKWFLPEIHSQAAERVLRSRKDLLAPDLVWAEVGSVLWKKVRRNEITVEEADGILKDFLRFPLQTYETKALLNTAWDLAKRTAVNVYDALYLALAIGQSCHLVTADRRFYEAVQKHWGSKVLWIEDVG